MRMVILQKNAENRARGKETAWSERLGERERRGGNKRGSERVLRWQRNIQDRDETDGKRMRQARQ